MIRAALRWLWPRAELARLRAELADLREDFENPELAGLKLDGRLLEMKVEGGPAQILAASFMSQFKRIGATNYVEIVFDTRDPEVGPLVVTLQRVEGKTPGTVVRELQGELARLRADAPCA